MKTMVVGDIHGCGLELQELIAKAGLDRASDQLVLIGDLFDRAMHGHLVWGVIQEWGDRCYCLQGNHERKMLKYLLNERKDLPPHYYWAMDNLKRIGVLGANLTLFLSLLPTILVADRGSIPNSTKIVNPVEMKLKGATTLLPHDVILAHAGIDVHYPLNPDPSFTVYGDVKTKGKEWWERYTGENLVVYGHLSELDQKPRIRKHCLDFDGSGEYLSSIGIDTACAHGGYLTGYIIETGEFHSVKAEKDWATALKKEQGLK